MHFWRLQTGISWLHHDALKWQKILFFGVIFPVLFSGCSKHLKPDHRPTERDFGESIRSYPFIAPDDRKRRVVDNYPRLELGMRKDQVAEIIGEPDYSEPTQRKEDPVGSSWVYAFYCTGRFCGTTSQDDLLQVFFDLGDKVIGIFPSPRLKLEPKRAARF